MDINCIMAMIVGGLLIIGLDITFIVMLFKGWIQEKRLISDFPSWKSTRKPLFWWLIWSCAIVTNVIIFILCSFLSKTVHGVYTNLIALTPVYSVIIGFIYICVKNALKSKHDNL